MASENESGIRKQGVINKCPNCGGPLKAFSTVCELCGHELAGIGANRTIEAIVQQFQKIEQDVIATGATGAKLDTEVTLRKGRFIRDLPVPNSREDLLSLLHYIRPKIEDAVKPDPNSEEWKAKFREVMSLAKSSFKGDAKVRAEFEEIEKSLQITMSSAMKTRARRSPVMAVVVAVVVVAAVAGIVSTQVEKRKFAQCEVKFDQDAAAENSRLSALVEKVKSQLNSQKFTDANATLTDIKWTVQTECKQSVNSDQNTAWDQRHTELATVVTQAKSETETQQHNAEDRAAADTAKVEQQAAAETAKVDQQAADAKKAEADRVAAEKAEAKRKADLEASKTATAKRNAATNKEF